jgi:hypothetical protein
MGRTYGHGLDPKEARSRDSEVVWRVSRNILNYTSSHIGQLEIPD